MRNGYRLAVLGVIAISAGCANPEATVGPPDSADLHRSGHGRATPVLTGSGDHTRIVGTDTALTTFDFHVMRLPDSSAVGHYLYNFRAAGFEVEGHVTCATKSGNQAWVSGVVDQVRTDNPELEELLGLEMWWRSKDGGPGPHAPPDSTTGLGFGFAGTPITGESWCRDQPVALIMRAVERVNLRVW
jgi:hypothetical protein